MSGRERDSKRAVCAVFGAHKCRRVHSAQLPPSHWAGTLSRHRVSGAGRAGTSRSRLQQEPQLIRLSPPPSPRHDIPLAKKVATPRRSNHRQCEEMQRGGHKLGSCLTNSWCHSRGLFILSLITSGANNRKALIPPMATATTSLYSPPALSSHRWLPPD